jgi:hypothetical protein
MRMLCAIVFSACLLLAAPNAASAQTSALSCNSRAVQLWQDAIDDEEGTNEQRAERIADLYAKGGSGNEVLFLPTASPDLVTDKAGIIKYFTSFVATKPKVTFTECKTIARPGNNVVLFAGFYYFTNTKDCPGRLLARFSFLIDLTDNKIAHHHSSVLPVDDPCRKPTP